MCGICGIINFKGNSVDEQNIRRMMRILKHRGPDDEGVYLCDHIGLGHVRLSIIDLSKAGHQPMFDESGRYCILHNGEVYNYVEIRQKLEDKYRFMSLTDTEVLLYSYIEWGTGCLERLNGMFAFAIYDTEKNELFIARDRFGIKPLYYCIDDTSFVFASEIPAILSVLPEKNTINDAAIFDYLVFNRTDQNDETFMREIKRLDHGHYMVYSNNVVAIKKWYSLQERIGCPFTGADDFRETFIDTVNLRLRSDVPVGVCLSGGLDSSSITSVMAKVLHKEDLQTFSAVYGDGIEGDESEYVNLLREDVFKMHKITPNENTLLDDIESFIMCHGEPVPSTGPYAQYKVMELARGNVKVLLDGQGGDEILAGYHYFFGTYLRELLTQLRLIVFVRELVSYCARHRSVYALQSLMFYSLPNALKTRARLTGRNCLNRDFFAQQSSNTHLPETLFDARTLQQSLLYHFAYKLEHLLKWEDRNSMFFSLESRVPFLDHRLVEKTLSLSSEKVIRNGMTKHILRQAMNGVIPETIRMRRDKVGFSTPEQQWFRTRKLRVYFEDILESDIFRKRPYFDHRQCLKLYKAHMQRHINISRDIWKWINLELWLRRLESQTAG
jgi:asparagine synthase (glutamine-hydrolysing)